MGFVCFTLKPTRWGEQLILSDLIFNFIGLTTSILLAFCFGHVPDGSVPMNGYSNVGGVYVIVFKFLFVNFVFMMESVHQLPHNRYSAVLHPKKGINNVFGRVFKSVCLQWFFWISSPTKQPTRSTAVIHLYLHVRKWWVAHLLSGPVTFGREAVTLNKHGHVCFINYYITRMAIVVFPHGLDFSIIFFDMSFCKWSMFGFLKMLDGHYNNCKTDSKASTYTSEGD